MLSGDHYVGDVVLSPQHFEGKSCATFKVSECENKNSFRKSNILTSSLKLHLFQIQNQTGLFRNGKY